MQEKAGNMVEKKPHNQKEGQNHLTGYQPSERERKEKNSPREVARLAGSYGQVAVGVNGEKQLSITVSERRGGEKKQATKDDEKAVRGDGTRKMEATRGQGFTNPSQKTESAVLYKTATQQPPVFLRKRFAQMVTGQRVMERHLPFLSDKEERDEETHLLQQEKLARTEGGNLSPIQARRDELAQIRTEKAQQCRRFQQMLKQGQQAAQGSQGKEWAFLEVIHQLETENSEDAQEPSEDDDGQTTANP